MGEYRSFGAILAISVAKNKKLKQSCRKFCDPKCFPRKSMVVRRPLWAVTEPVTLH